MDTVVKHKSIVKSLRGDILRGVYVPGGRLPSRAQISRTYGAGMATVQKALDTLIEDGFVHAKAGSGTFVVERPPHLCNYAISIPEAELWSCYYDAFREAMGDVSSSKDIEFREYLTSRDVASRQGIRNLCRDSSHNKLAGIIVSGDPTALADTGIFNNPAVPCVANQFAYNVPFPKTCLDDESFLNRAIEFLSSRGRRRIAHLFMDFEARHMVDFENQMKRLNVEVRPYWVQSVPMTALFRSVTNVVHLLVQAEMYGERPDALIIHDDNLIDHAIAGILAAGVRVPENMDVIVKFNFPSRRRSLLPITRLGVDLRDLLNSCIEILDKQRNGEPVPDKTGLPALFEHEIRK